jgi:outer membrane receptor for ferrienterochelin and colicins
VYGFSGIPSSLIKRVEVVKGPASTLYGSEAVAGLINIITKDPISAARFSSDLNITSYKEVNADLSGKFRIGKAHSLVGLNAFLFNTRFDVNRDNFTDVTLQKRISFFNKWSLERPNNQPMSLALRLLHEDRWGGEMDWSKRWRGSDSVYGESIYTKRFEMIGNYGLPFQKEKLLLEYSYNYHNQDSYYGQSAYLAIQHTAFAQLRWDKTMGKHNLLIGAPYRFTWYDDNTPATLKPDGIRNNPSEIVTKGLFVQDEIKLSQAFTTLAGIRYEHNSLQGAVWSPRLAFKYQQGVNHTFRLSGGNGFRIVNLITEDHMALSGARELVISETLKPEKSWNGNFNYTGLFTPSFGYISMDASAFYTYFTNKIVPDYDSDPQRIIYSNLKGHAISKGVAANLEMTFKKGLRIMSGFTLMDVYSRQPDSSGKIEKQQQLFAPRFSATYAIGYTLPKWGVTIDFTGKVYGPQRLPVVPNDFRPEYSPWFTLANLQLTKKLQNGIEIYGGIKNLFNFMPRDPILRPFDPFDKTINDPVNNPNGYTFDPSYNYAPVQRMKGMVGFRFTL